VKITKDTLKQLIMEEVSNLPSAATSWDQARKLDRTKSDPDSQSRPHLLQLVREQGRKLDHLLGNMKGAEGSEEDKFFTTRLTLKAALAENDKKIDQLIERLG